jgi:hypothetical protein
MSVFRKLAQLFSGGGTDSGEGRRCEAGLHWMDPHWARCPYCDAEHKARPSKPSQETHVSQESHVGQETRVQSADSASGAARQLKGVLVTFSWRREGQLFPVYEGKNRIGSGGEGACEVQITTDRTLSREHALIRCLEEEYEIFDQKSQNGTFMNEERVPVHGTALKDRSRIKTGATDWMFLKIPAPQSRESHRSADEGFAPSPVRDDAQPAEGRSHVTHPTTVPGLEEVAKKDERRPTTFFDAEEKPAASKALETRLIDPLEREAPSTPRRNRDKTSIVEPSKPKSRGKDDPTNIY